MTMMTLRAWIGLPLTSLEGASVREGEVALGRDETRGVRVRRAGATVECLDGMVWITFEGDPEDHIVSAGGSFSVRRAGRLALLALEPAWVRVRR